MVSVKKIVEGQEILEEDSIIRECRCFTCANLLLYPNCIAFPEGIPRFIRNGLHDHSIRIEGDGGFIYKYVGELRNNG